MCPLVVQREEPCLGRLVIVWGGYGLALALLAQSLHGLPFGAALAWAVGAAAAVCLLLCWEAF